MLWLRVSYQLKKYLQKRIMLYENDLVNASSDKTLSFKWPDLGGKRRLF